MCNHTKHYRIISISFSLVGLIATLIINYHLMDFITRLSLNDIQHNYPKNNYTKNNYT